jgi:hypothetical protein
MLIWHSHAKNLFGILTHACDDIIKVTVESSTITRNWKESGCDPTVAFCKYGDHALSSIIGNFLIIS